MDHFLTSSDSSGTVVAIRPLHVADATSRAIVGVVGAVLSNQTIQGILERATSQYNETLQSDGSDIDGLIRPLKFNPDPYN